MSINRDESIIERKELFESLSTIPSSSDLRKLNENEIKNEFQLDRYRYLRLITYIIMCFITGPSFLNWKPLYELIRRSNIYSDRCDSPDGCNDMDIAISAILPVAAGVMYSVDIIAGLLLDSLGTKVVTLFGLSLQICGWILTAISYEFSLYNWCLPGFVLIAIGNDSTYYGIVSISNLFPDRCSTIIAILSGARSVSYANILLIQFISPNVLLSTVSYIFIGLLLFWVLFAIFFIPWFPYPDVSNPVILQEYPSNQTTGLFKQFLFYSLTPAYSALCVLVILSFIRNIWFSVSYKQHFSDTAVNLYTILNPLTFVTSPLLGHFGDYFGISNMILLQSVCGVSSMLFLFVPSVTPAFQYLSVMFNFICVTFSTTQFCIFVSFCYPQKLMGRLVGFAVLLGGLSSFGVSWLYNANIGNIKYVDAGIMMSSIASAALCVYLFIFFEKPIRRTRKKSLQTGPSHPEV